MAKYNSVETIPARTFFEILKTKDFSLLLSESEDDDLEKIFIDIYDDYFVRSDNKESKKYLQLTKNIAFLEYKINTIKQMLHYIIFTPNLTEEMQNEIIDAVKIGCKINIDKNQPFLEEMERVLQVEVGILENDLNFAKMQFDEMTNKSQNKDFDYYDSIGVLSNTLQGNSLLREDMSLAVYITLEKLANKIVKSQKV